MDSTSDLLRKFRKIDLTETVAPPAPQHAPAPAPAQDSAFVRIRRKGLAGDAADVDQEVSQEAIVDAEGVVGLGG